MSFGAGLAAAGLATIATQAECAPATEKAQAPVSEELALARHLLCLI